MLYCIRYTICGSTNKSLEVKKKVLLCHFHFIRSDLKEVQGTLRQASGLGPHAFTAKGEGSIPGQGTKILQAT